MTTKRTKAKPLRKSLDNKYPPVEVGAAWQDWTNFNAFTKAHNITRRALVRLIDEGEYTCFTAPDGTIRIPSNVEEELEEELELNEEEDAEEDADESADTATVLGQCVSMLKTANDFIDKLLTSVVKPLELTTKTNEEVLKRTLARLTELETKRDELVAQREEMLNEEAERRFAQTRIEAEEKRKDEAWQELIKMMPILGDQLKSTVARLGGPQRKALDAAMSLLGTLEPEQLEVLGSDQLGFLNEKQRAHLRELMAHLPKKESAPAPAPASAPAPAPAEPPTKAESPKPKRRRRKAEP